VQGDLKGSPYTIQEGYPFKHNKPCIPRELLRELLVSKAHGGALVGHFGLNKANEIPKEYFYWHKIWGDVHKIILACFICHKTKSDFRQGLYS